ncbi:hypothetical protein LCGC14_2462490, partial [marine sediment metagenome]
MRKILIFLGLIVSITAFTQELGDLSETATAETTDIFVVEQSDATRKITKANLETTLGISDLESNVSTAEDSIAAHDVKINTNIQSASDNADSITAHDTKINTNIQSASDNSDSIAAHLVRLDDGVDSTGVHDGKINTNITDIASNVTAIGINTTQLADTFGIKVTNSYGSGIAESASANIIAFRAAIAAGGDGKIFFPAGKFLIDDTILIEGSPQLFGAGWSDEGREGQTTIETTVDKPIFHFYADDGADGYGWEYGSRLRNIHLQGTNSDAATEQHGIVINGSVNLKVEDVYLTEFGGYAIYIGNKFHTDIALFDNVHAQHNHLGGVYGQGTFTKQINAITFRNCAIS